MAVLTRAYSEVDGSIGEASSINRVIDDIYSTINALNSANLLASSVGTTQLEDSSITTIKLADCSITTIKMADCAVTVEKIDSTARGVNLAEGKIFLTEFF